MVIREITFYAFSIIFLYVTISDRRPVDFDSPDIDHLYISLFDGSLLCGCYTIYVIVCVNFTKIVSLLKLRDGIEMIERKNISYVEEATNNDYHAFDNQSSSGINISVPTQVTQYLSLISIMHNLKMRTLYFRIHNNDSNQPNNLQYVRFKNLKFIAKKTFSCTVYAFYTSNLP